MNAPRATLLLLLSATLALTACEKVKTLTGITNDSTSPTTLTGDKIKKYVAAQADLANHPFHKELGLYTENNKELALADPKHPYHQDLSQYFNPSSPVTSAIARLQEAATVPVDLGPLDAAAARLLASLQALNPTIKDMDVYINAHQVEVDGGAKALAFDALYRPQMTDAEDAARAFSQALSDRSMAEDTATLATLKPGSLDYALSSTSVTTRRAVDALDNITSTADPKLQAPAKAAFAASLQPLDQANHGLTTALAQYHGHAEMDSCKQFNTRTTHLVATGREAAQSPFAKALHGENKAQAFVSEYNDTISDFNYCFQHLHGT